MKMPKSEKLISRYRDEFGSHIEPSQTEHLKAWLEQQTGKKINYPLYVTNGSGGGQKYRLLYLLQAVEHNAGKQAVFYSEMSSLNDELKEKYGHIPLEEIITGE